MLIDLLRNLFQFFMGSNRALAIAHASSAASKNGGQPVSSGGGICNEEDVLMVSWPRVCLLSEPVMVKRLKQSVKSFCACKSNHYKQKTTLSIYNFKGNVWLLNLYAADVQLLLTAR